MPLLLALPTLSLAADPTDEPLSDVVARLAPDVEAITGRAFGERPEARWVSRREYRELLLQDAGGAGFDDAHRTLPDGSVAALWWVLGQYRPDDDAIVLVREQLHGMQDALALDDDETDAMFRCLLVHEMVHALDTRHEPDLSWDALDRHTLQGLRLLREGHASYVEGRWCTEQYGALAAARSNPLRQMASSLDPSDSRVAYAWGEMLVEALYARDPEAYWTLAGDTPPSFHLEQLALGPVLAPGWTDPSPLAQTLRGLGFEKPGAAHPAALVDLLEPLGVRPPSGAPASTGGLQLSAGYTSYNARIYAFALEDPESASAVIEARVAQTADWRSRIPAVDRESTARIDKVVPKRTRWLERRGVASHAIVFQTTFRPYVELWAIEGRRMVVLTTYAVRGKGRRRLQRLAHELLQALPPDVAPGEVWLAPLLGDR